MRIRLRGINSKQKRLADGSFKTYYWAWKGGPPLRGEPGTPEFVHSYNEAIATKAATPQGKLLSVLQAYQASGEFNGLAARTRRDYVEKIKIIEAKFGDFPLSALSARGARAVFMEWRDKLATKSRRQADYAWSVFARVLSWALDRGLVSRIPARRAVGSTAARVSIRSGPPTTRPRFSNPHAQICICHCCSRCGPASDKAISCGCPGRLTMGRIFACGHRRAACASRSRSARR
jgi:hypothetical protein